MLAVLGCVGVSFVIIVSSEPPPSFGCTDVPAGAEQALTAYRALAFGLAGLLALGIGIAASAWSSERRRRSDDHPRPGIPTILSATLPVLALALAVVESDVTDGALLWYFVYGAVLGIVVVPALTIIGLVIAIASESWQASEQGRARLEALTIVIADGLVVFGLPLAVTAAYLQGGGPLFC